MKELDTIVTKFYEDTDAFLSKLRATKDPYADGDKAFDEARDNELVEEPIN